MVTFPRVLATTSEDKITEWNRIVRALHPDIEISPIARKETLMELQGDPVSIAVTKAIDAYYRIGSPVLVEDVAFIPAAFNGFPSAYYAPCVGKGIENHRFLRMFLASDSRDVVALTQISFYDPATNQVYISSGELAGTIPMTARGKNGFGFDEIIVPKVHPSPEVKNMTLAEMTNEQKDAVSMRRLAIQNLLDGKWSVQQASQSLLARYMILA